jgi:hypothetical protein
MMLPVHGQIVGTIRVSEIIVQTLILYRTCGLGSDCPNTYRNRLDIQRQIGLLNRHEMRVNPFLRHLGLRDSASVC